jgi:hypothetical protein
VRRPEIRENFRLTQSSSFALKNPRGFSTLRQRRIIKNLNAREKGKYRVDSGPASAYNEANPFRRIL